MENRSMPPGDVIPVLSYRDVPTSVEWLWRVFGLRERLRIGTHRSQLVLGGGAVIVASGLNGRPEGASVLIKVVDVDEHYRRCVGAGATILREPQTYPFGERQYSALDVGGYEWTFSQTVEDANPEEWGGELITR